MTDSARELFVVRHGKSDWDTDAASDFDRPLARRGRRDCRTMAAWCADQGLLPDVVLSSPAERAADTARRISRGLGVLDDEIRFEERLYHADLETLLMVLAEADPGARKVLLVGHNPGLDDLVVHLHDGVPGTTRSGKLMTTAAVAHFAMPESWTDLPRGGGDLIELVRPKDLPPR